MTIFLRKATLFLLPLVVSVLANITSFALFGAMNLIAQIHARTEHAAKFDLSVGLHVHNYGRVFIKSKVEINSALQLW